MKISISGNFSLWRKLPPQFDKVMKLTAIFLLAFFMQLSAKSVSQVTLSLKNASVEKVFREVERQTGVGFLYTRKMVRDLPRVSINVRNASISEVLNECFSDQPLEYSLDKNTIVITRSSERPSTILTTQSMEAGMLVVPPPVEISGRVTDQQGNPLANVSVMISGTSVGTTTNSDGRFRITAPDNQNVTLEFSSVGFVAKRMNMGSQTEVNVVLEAADAGLDEVVVVGYGTVAKKDLTGAVTQVNAEKLENENPTNVQDLLRGNAVGLNVGFDATAKGGGTMEVRGQKSLNAGTEPLLVVDGIIYNGSMDDINPLDIQTIDVLKDASSAAVFGAKAANGVIVITTKMGKTGKPIVNFNNSIGLATMSVNQPINSAEEYITWREDVLESQNPNALPYKYRDPMNLPSTVTLEDWLAYDNSAGDPTTVWLQRLNFQQVELDNYKEGKSINWYDKMFRNGLQQDYNVSLSNRTDKVNYYWSLGYQNKEGIVVGDEYNTIKSRLNLEGEVTSFLKVGLNTQFSYRDESAVPVDWPQMTMISPWGSEFNDDGTLRFSPQDDPVAIPLVSRNPLLDPAYTDRVKKYYVFNSSIYAKMQLPFGITYQLNFTPRFEWFNYLNHISSKDPQYTPVGGIASRTQSLNYNWQLDNLFKWNKSFNNVHNLDLTFLINGEKYQSWYNEMSNNHFSPNDQLGFSWIEGGINPIIRSIDEYSTADALMGRLNYRFKDRYMATFSIRRDGYSAFGQSNPRASFPAGALGWVFTNEDFFKVKWLSRGKIRFSYGINGNRDIGRYAAFSQLSSGNYLNVTSDGSVLSLPTLEISTMSNRELKWEKTTSANIGLDFSILNIFEGSVDLYKMETTDLLVRRTLPTTTGYDFVMANLGQVNNRGLEINLNSKNINKENISWNTSFNFSLNRNKIIHLYGGKQDVFDEDGKLLGQQEPDDVINKWFIGHAIDEIWDLKILGVWQESERAEAAKYGVSPGDFKIQDVNNDGLYTNEDRQFLGYRQPRYRWTMRNEFKLYKNLSVSFTLYSYWGQKDTFNVAKGVPGYGGAGYPRWTGFSHRNSAYVLPYWTPENPINDYARNSSASGGALFDVWRDKSFVRLDNVSIAYSLNRQVIERFKIQELKIFFTVRNVGFYSPGTFLWDPEYFGPTPRTYTIGLNFSL